MVQIPKKYNLKPEDAPLCACSCGQQVMFNKRYKGWSKFAKGHSGRLVSEGTKKKMRESSRKRWGDPADRFRSRIGKPDDKGCMLWQGSMDRDGYGVMKWWGKTVKAHRVAWELSHGEIPENTLVCHHCDIPGCVNHEHLFLGTCATNHADRNKKGRQTKGEKHWAAKLTADKVRAIKALSKEGFSYSQLATMFEVTKGNIDHICNERSWKHI